MLQDIKEQSDIIEKLVSKRLLTKDASAKILALIYLTRKFKTFPKFTLPQAVLREMREYCQAFL
ncbi:MAG: hypothetical protein MZV70_76920 [Desulfobacterales bacterium]|nr:hypothetical protein [Desulfobacterales bacterium]